MPKKLLSAMLCVAMIALCATPCAAVNWYQADPYGYGEALVTETAADPSALSLDCRAALLMEPQTGRVIYEKNSDERMPEASITKVMTMLLVFEALDSGAITMDDEVVCSDYAASMGGSQIWLEPGEVMTVHDLIKASMVASANDASTVLAEYVGGSHEAFVAMMNARAAQLGLDNTAYKNCTGLDAEGHVTSARDIAVVSAELMRHEQVFEFSTIWMDSLRGGTTQLVNTNKLVRYYSGISGLKTGTTSQAGCCVVATAERDGMTLIAVVMGAPNSKTRFACASSLLDFGFASWELLDLSDIAVSTSDVPVLCGMEKSVCTHAEMSGCVLVPKGRGGDIAVSVDMAPDAAAPVDLGQQVGAVTLTLDGQALGSYCVLTDAPVEAISFRGVMRLLVGLLIGHSLC